MTGNLADPTVHLAGKHGISCGPDTDDEDTAMGGLRQGNTVGAAPSADGCGSEKSRSGDGAIAALPLEGNINVTAHTCSLPPPITTADDRRNAPAIHRGTQRSRRRARDHTHHHESRKDQMKTLMYVLCASSLAACAIDDDMNQPDDDSQTAIDDQSIIGGTIDHGDLCVVKVIVHEPGLTALCTGTIIGPHTVLTAAHCVTPESSGGITQIELAEPGHIFPNISAATWTHNPAWNRGNPEACHDEGIIHTFQTLSPICNRGRFHPHGGVRIVGYGVNTHADTGSIIKRQATVAIHSPDSNSFRAGRSKRQACHGDSGGPAFQGGQVVGVDSFGDDRSTTSVCFGGSVYCRVDADAAWINDNTL